MTQQLFFWVSTHPKLKTFICKDICTPRFIATLFTVAKTWKQPKCPLMDDWVKKMWYVYTMEHYSLIRKEILPFATTWMDPENTLLSEISHTEKVKNILFHSYVGYTTESNK